MAKLYPKNPNENPHDIMTELTSDVAEKERSENMEKRNKQEKRASIERTLFGDQRYSEHR